MTSLEVAGETCKNHFALNAFRRTYFFTLVNLFYFFAVYYYLLI